MMMTPTIHSDHLHVTPVQYINVVLHSTKHYCEHNTGSDYILHNNIIGENNLLLHKCNFYGKGLLGLNANHWPLGKNSKSLNIGAI